MPIEDWTEERVAQLTRLWIEGQTCDQIARQMYQWGFTRSAIIGKAHRLKLHIDFPRKPSVPAQKKPRKVKAIRPPRRWVQAVERVHNHEPAQATFVPDIALIPDLHGLKWWHCRFPIGESPNVSYCGAAKLEGLPYCERHARRCYLAVPMSKPVEVPERKVA